MRAGGKQGRERAGVAGVTRCLTHFSGLGAERGSLRRLLRSPGAASPLSPAATAETLLCRLLSTGVCTAAVTRDLAPAAGPASGSTVVLLPALLGSVSSPPKPLCPALPGLRPRTRGKQCPCRAVCPGDVGTSGWSTVVPSAEGCCSHANR